MGQNKVAEIEKFSIEERKAYKQSLKYYRDIKNVVDSSKHEGRKEEKYAIAQEMKKAGEPIQKIIRYTKPTKAEIDKL